MVRGNDHLGTTPNSCGQNMSVIWVSKIEGWNQVFVSGHKTIIYGLAHEVPRSIQFYWIKARAVFLQISKDLI